MGFRSSGLSQARTGSPANHSEFFINSKRTAEPHASLYCLTPREAIKVQHLNYHSFYFIFYKTQRRCPYILAKLITNKINEKTYLMGVGLNNKVSSKSLTWQKRLNEMILNYNFKSILEFCEWSRAGCFRKRLRAEACLGLSYLRA